MGVLAAAFSSREERMVVIKVIFCSRQSPINSLWTYLELRQHINRIMEARPTLHTKSITVQLQSLIVDSLHCLSPLPQRSYLVIRDGLDECRAKATQQSIVRLLWKMSTDHKLPLQFLIGSRLGSHIRSSFDHVQSPGVSSSTKNFILEKIFGCFYKTGLRRFVSSTWLRFQCVSFREKIKKNRHVSSWTPTKRDSFFKSRNMHLNLPSS